MTAEHYSNPIAAAIVTKTPHQVGWLLWHVQIDSLKWRTLPSPHPPPTMYHVFLVQYYRRKDRSRVVDRLAKRWRTEGADKMVTAHQFLFWKSSTVLTMDQPNRYGNTTTWLSHHYLLAPFPAFVLVSGVFDPMKNHFRVRKKIHRVTSESTRRIRAVQQFTQATTQHMDMLYGCFALCIFTGRPIWILMKRPFVFAWQIQLHD